MELFVICLKIFWSLLSYIGTKQAERAAAAAVVGARLKELEAKGFNVMQDILKEQGRSSWIPWDQVPQAPMPPQNSEPSV